MINKIRGLQTGQAMVETMFSVIIITIMFFSAVQVSMIAIAWLKANEASQAALRCAIASKGSTSQGAEGQEPAVQAQKASFIALGTGLPAKTVIWDKYPLGSAGNDHSSGPDNNGARINMFSAHVYYIQQLMFSSMFGQLASLGFLSVASKHGPTGAAHCRMVKPPDWRYYEKAYPGAYKFDE